MKKYIKKIWELYKPFRKTILFLFVLVLLTQLLYLLPPILYAKMVDSIFSKESLNKSLLLVFYAFLAGLFSNVIINYIKEYVELMKLDYDVERYFQNLNINKILSFSIGQNNNENSGVKQSILDRGLQAVNDLAYESIYSIIPLFLQVFLAVFAMMIVNFYLGLIVLFGVGIFISLTFYINWKYLNKLKNLDDLFIDRDKEYTEILWNIPTN